MSELIAAGAERRVYCAGPLFNAAERRAMSHLAEILAAAGLEPWVPHADGMEFVAVFPRLVRRGLSAEAARRLLERAVFALDTYQVVVGCGSLAVNLNGRVPDEGAVAEATLAWFLGKPVVAFQDDVRTFADGRNNPLVAGVVGWDVLTDLEEVPRVLTEQLARRPAGTARDWPSRCPAEVARVLTSGAKLWHQLQSMGSERPADPIAELVLHLFDESSAAVSC